MVSESRMPTNTEDQFRILVQAISDYAIYMLDPDGHVTSWNPGAERAKGYAEAEIIGEYYGKFFTQADRAAGRPAQELALARDLGRYEDEGWRVRKDGGLSRPLWKLKAAQAEPLVTIGTPAEAS